MIWIQYMLVCALWLGSMEVQTQAPRMAEHEHPLFEVATIKPSDPANQRGGFHTEGRQIFIENRSVTSLIMYAYGLHPKQIVDGPEWMGDRYDIHGVTDLPGEPNRAQLREMLQKLLEERFGLKMHRDSREMAAYAITVAKGGPKLSPSKDPNGPSNQEGSGGANGQALRFTNVSMGDFAGLMQYFLDRPVINRTDLAGKYDFTLEYKPGLPAEPSASDFPDLFTAVRVQVGLKLNAVKDRVDVLVVDKLERPVPD